MTRAKTAKIMDFGVVSACSPAFTSQTQAVAYTKPSPEPDVSLGAAEACGDAALRDAPPQTALVFAGGGPALHFRERCSSL